MRYLLVLLLTGILAIPSVAGAAPAPLTKTTTAKWSLFGGKHSKKAKKVKKSKRSKGSSKSSKRSKSSR